MNIVKKITIISISAVFLIGIVASIAVKQFFMARFAALEKKQDQLLRIVNTLQNQSPVSASASSMFTAISEIGRLRKELVSLKDQVSEHTDLLGIFGATESTAVQPTEKSPYQFVTISDRTWQQVDVFQDTKSSSPIIGQARYGISYPYTKKESGYYYIDLNDTTSGWIHSQFVREF